MKRLIFALSLALMLLAAPGIALTAYGFTGQSYHSQLMTSSSYQPVDYYYTYTEHDYDRPYYGYHNSYSHHYDPYYEGYYSGYSAPDYDYYYSSPGFSIGLPFFYFHAG